ncbi:MAG: hypothetical protein HON53_15755 [Planctomycetaceae bacterium]|nr:hypothetical protein [Planctomycetaceae bacterium]
MARPGVYQAPLTEPYLMDLLHNAGGFSAGANGYLRIIRNGPNGVQASYATGRDFQLRRGDVVVAIRKTGLAINPRSVDQRSGISNDANAGDESPPTHVQLAFVNLTDRPVVLRMRRENASVGRILELLGHSPNLAQTVRVISHAETPHFTSADQQLASESVLVFDSAVIRRDRLPELPTEIVNDTRKQQEAVATVYTDETSETPDGDQQQFQLAAVGDPPVKEVPTPLDFESSKHTEDVKLKSKPVSQSQPSARNTKQPKPIRIQNLPAELLTINEPLALPDAREAEADAGGWFSFLMYSFLTLSICAGAGWGIMRFVRRKGQPKRLEVSSRQVESEQPSELNEIIYDQLPVVEESLTQSDRLSVFSRTGTQKQTRNDQTHGVPRPHFLPETAIPDTVIPEQEQPPRGTSISAEVATTSGGKKFRVDAKHEQDAARQPVTVANHAGVNEPQGQGLLDRVLSRVQGAAKR